MKHKMNNRKLKNYLIKKDVQLKIAISNLVIYAVDGGRHCSNDIVALIFGHFSID